jgi:hypothetical protein
VLRDPSAETATRPQETTAPRDVAEPAKRSAPPDRRRRAFGARFALLTIFLAAATYHAAYALQTRGYYVMTDELQYLKLAYHLNDGPIPQLHGQFFAALDPLYPLLLWPLTLIGSVPDFFVAAHILNPLIMTSVVFPTYLLAVELTESRRAALFAAAIAVAGPWLVFTNVLMTENAAYPAFTWAMLGVFRAMSRPSPRTDLLALAGVLLAIAARTQFVILLPVVVVAVAIQRYLIARGAERLDRRHSLPAALRSAARLHRTALLVLGGMSLVALAVAPIASPSSVVGIYGPVLERSLVPEGTFSHMLRHASILTVGFGTLPVMLAAAYVISGMRRGAPIRHLSFAVLASVTCVAIMYQASAFNINFSGGGLNDRYVFYLVPLIAIGMVAALSTRVSTRAIAAGALGVVVLIPSGAFKPYSGDSWTGAPAAAVYKVLSGRLTEFNYHLGTGLTVKPVLMAGALFFAVLIAVGLRRQPTATLVTVCVMVVFWNVASTQYQFDSQGSWTRPSLALVKNSISTDWLGVASTAQSPPKRAHLDWLDDAPAARGQSVALLPSGSINQLAWWQDEFWNRRVDKMYRYENPSDVPRAPLSLFHQQLQTLHHDAVRVDWKTGAVSGMPPERVTPFVVMAEFDPRFAFAGVRRLATHAHPELGLPERMFLLRVPVPYRAAWMTRNVLDDGWTVGERSELRIFPSPGAEGRRLKIVTLRLAANPAMHRKWRWTVDAGGKRVAGATTPDDVLTTRVRTRRVRICVGRTAETVLSLRVMGKARMPDKRVAGLRVAGISVTDTGRSCS